MIIARWIGLEFRRWILVGVATLSVGACAALTSPQPGIFKAGLVIPPRQFHAEVRDTSVDALPDYRVLVSPDIVMAIVDVDATEVKFRLRHRPGSFDPTTTRFAIDLDIDQNAATGSGGIEYQIFVFPVGGSGGADVARTTTTGSDVLASVPVSFVEDGCDFAVPLRLLGSDDGRFDFRVRVYSQPALPLVIDVLPDNGLIRVQ